MYVGFSKVGNKKVKTRNDVAVLDEQFDLSKIKNNLVQDTQNEMKWYGMVTSKGR